MAKFMYAETYPERLPSLGKNVMFAGLLSGPLLRTAGSTMWQHITSNIAYFNSLADIPADFIPAAHRSR
jgi:hypothetical protein